MSKEGGLYLADYGTGDVHWIQARMTCTDCHDGAELHGSGVMYANRYEVEEAPDCQDCHPQSGLNETSAHSTHQEKLSCYVCHSAGPVKTCTGCHEGYNAEGSRFRTSDVSYVFKIGTNPNPTEDYPYEYVTVRKVPTVEDSFEGFGVTLENYDAVPSWKMSTPHNIRKTTRYNRSCDSCHGHPELFLSEEDLGPNPSEADLSVVVPNPPN
jgi:thiosulfate/3-mercaptopyruvate sulfurtransferase